MTRIENPEKLPLWKLVMMDVAAITNTEDQHVYVVIAGDYGGQVYATIPLFGNITSNAWLRRIAGMLDRKAWNDPEGVMFHFVRARSGETFPGGMGGGEFHEGIWIHAELEACEMLVRLLLKDAWKRESEKVLFPAKVALMRRIAESN
jgi:hypothetical protein